MTTQQDKCHCTIVVVWRAVGIVHTHQLSPLQPHGQVCISSFPVQLAKAMSVVAVNKIQWKGFCHFWLEVLQAGPGSDMFLSSWHRDCRGRAAAVASVTWGPQYLQWVEPLASLQWRRVNGYSLKNWHRNGSGTMRSQNTAIDLMKTVGKWP